MADRTRFDNQRFWNERYRSLPEFGSGPGSRGYAALYKRRLVAGIIASHPITTVLDIGCGDLCYYDAAAFSSICYRGFDISDVIVEKNRRAYPTLQFERHDISGAPIEASADLVICFDVLIHQLERADFLTCLANVLGSIGRLGLLSYKTPPGPDGQVNPEGPTRDASQEEIALEQGFRALRSSLPPHAAGQTAFHGPLPDHIKALRSDLEVNEIGRYRYQTVYLVAKR